MVLPSTTHDSLAFHASLFLNGLSGLTSPFSVLGYQTSSPFLVPLPSSYLDPRMSVTASPSAWIPSAWDFGPINYVSHLSRKQPGWISLFQDYHPLSLSTLMFVLFFLFTISTSYLYHSPQVPDLIHYSLSRSKTKTRGSRQELLSFPSICKCV